MAIRRDIYSVKVPFDSGTVGNSFRWSHVEMYKTPQSAKAFAQAEFEDRQKHGGPFPLRKPKIVHPSQKTVDLYLLCGNIIRE